METIFVVDDNSVNLMTADDALSDFYNVYTFASGLIMFEVLGVIKPDIILLDIMMPEMDGFEVLKRLKTDEQYAKIPVIFLTGKSDAATEARGFEMGVVDFVTKPFSDQILFDCLKKHLNTKKI